CAPGTTICKALDFNDDAYSTPSGNTVALSVDSPANIHAGTGVAAIESIACQSATLCVAGDGLGDATTWAVPLNPGKPVLGRAADGRPAAGADARAGRHAERLVRRRLAPLRRPGLRLHPAAALKVADGVHAHRGRRRRVRRRARVDRHWFLRHRSAAVEHRRP